MKPDDFIEMLAPAAQECAKTSAIPASFTIAQAALESGWCTSRLAVEARNLFGVKAHDSWHGDTVTMNTREFLGGQWVFVPAKWRKYSDWLECLEDHADFLHLNKRYAKAFETTDGESFAAAIAAAGYATDPYYANKLVIVMRAHQLHKLDNQAR